MMDPLNTSGYELAATPMDTARALREMADGEDDYLGRLLRVAAIYVDAFPQMMEVVGKLDPSPSNSEPGQAQANARQLLDREEVIQAMQEVANAAIKSAELTLER